MRVRAAPGPGSRRRAQGGEEPVAPALELIRPNTEYVSQLVIGYAPEFRSGIVTPDTLASLVKPAAQSCRVAENLKIRLREPSLRL